MSKKTLFFIIFFFAIIFFCCASPVIVFAYWGFIPGVSDVLGTNTPRDLGVRYSAADQKSAETKLNSFFTEAGSAKPITLSDAEISSLIASWKWDIKPFSSVQVKCNADGTVSISGLLLTEALQQILTENSNADTSKMQDIIHQVQTFGKSFPFLIVVKITKQSTNLEIIITRFEFGRVDFPDSILAELNNAFAQMIAEQSDSPDNPFNYVNSLSITQGKVTITQQVSSTPR